VPHGDPDCVPVDQRAAPLRETVTPMLLARSFTLNPVPVIVSLVFWYWMGGVPRAILATPMLAVVKKRRQRKPLRANVKAIAELTAARQSWAMLS
jgi:hypothetical protein